jgi:hypothetical protein
LTLRGLGHFWTEFIDEAEAVHHASDWILQQDNARPHIALDIVGSLRHLDIHVLEYCLSYSPDFDAIDTANSPVDEMPRRLFQVISRESSTIQHV